MQSQCWEECRALNWKLVCSRCSRCICAWADWFQPTVIGAGQNPCGDFDRQHLCVPSWPSSLRLIHAAVFPQRVCNIAASTVQHAAIFNRGCRSQRKGLRLPLWNLAELCFGPSVHRFLSCFFSLSSWAAVKEWLLLNDKIMNVNLRKEREGGRRKQVWDKRREGEAGEASITELANVPSCQGVNLSEAMQCDIIYSEIPNLSALIFQPQHCLSQCARDEWSIYKTAAANLLKIYVQCHVQERSRIHSAVSLCQRTFKKSHFGQTENVINRCCLSKAVTRLHWCMPICLCN